MLPPDVDSILITLKSRYRNCLLGCAEGDAVPDLLSAEEQVSELVRTLGHDLLQIFVTVRGAQAKQVRGLCSCGRHARWFALSIPIFLSQSSNNGALGRIMFRFRT